MPFRPCLSLLAEKFIYEPTTGLFYHRLASGRHGRYPAGAQAGSVDRSGAVMLSVDGKNIQAHQVAVAFSQGQWAETPIRHVNGNRADNRICNLSVDPVPENKGGVTIAKLQEFLSYDPETGAFRWRLSPRFGVRPGSAAGVVNDSGYVVIGLSGRSMRAHRVAWAMMHGRWPVHHLDHMNGDRSDNRLSNLREVTQAQNNQNASVRSDNTTGVPGVVLRRDTGRFQASIQVDGKATSLGCFDTLDEAREARLSALASAHPFHNPERHH